MKTISFKVFIVPEPSTVLDSRQTNAIGGVTYDLYGYKSSRTIAEVEVTFELPEGFDPVELVIKGLKEKRKELHSEFRISVGQVNDRIERLQSIKKEVAA